MLDPIINWLTTAAFTAFGVPTTWAEVLGFITGAVCVYLVAQQHIWNWPIGIANNLLWILLFATAGLYADSGLQVVYIALALWGWWQWLHGGANRTARQVTTTSAREWVALLAAGAAATAVMAWVLATYTPSTVPLWDAVTVALSLMATWGMATKRLESWYLWMTADVLLVPLFYSKGLTLTAILYVGFFALCVKGLIEWRKALAAQNQTALVATPAGPVETLTEDAKA